MTHLPAKLWGYGQMVIRVRLLGDVTVWDKDKEVLLGSPKQRALLCVLAMHANEIVDHQALIDAIWGDCPPGNAPSSLYSYISGLRQVLEPSIANRSSRIMPSVRGGYMLGLAPERIDALLFTGQVKRARRLAEGGNHAGALTVFQDALALWQGSALAGATGPFAEIERTRLGELRFTAIEDRLEMLLHLGRHNDAVADLYGLVREFPLRERLRCSLMLALYRSGRQAEALEVFRDARETLIRELGIEPGYELRRCHEEVLAGTIHLVAPHAVEGVYTGSSRLAPLGGAPVLQLPPAAPDFTGRTAERARIIEVLEQARDMPGVPVVVVSGAAGTGKTALSLDVAYQLSDRFPGGQFYAELTHPAGAPRRPDEVLDGWLRSMGVPEAAIPAGLVELAALFRSRLALGQDTLIVIDNAVTAEQVRPLLPGRVGCAVIVTSRVRLMTVAGAQTLVLGSLSPSEAIGMLGKIIGDGRIVAEREAAEHLMRFCGCHPLAIRIAGAKLVERPDLSVSALARGMAADEARLDMLEAGDLSVRSGIAWSYWRLDPVEQRAFRLLGLLQRDSFAPWVVAALTGTQDVGRIIDGLVNKCMLTPLGGDVAGRRYHLPSLLHAYARDRLREAPAEEAEQAMNRMLAAWRERASKAHAWVRLERRATGLLIPGQREPLHPDVRFGPVQGGAASR
jgi:DNA-binding SARP family transcriptional activator